MAMANLEAIVAALIAGGRPASTGVSVVQEGGTARQRALMSTLGDAVAEVAEAGLGSPAVVVVGDVVDAARAIHLLRPAQ
jgi:siroheme synthase